MSKLNPKMLAVFLLTAMTALSVAGQGGSLMVVMSARPAGCHQPGAKPPASRPVSYRCCQSGHDSAILQTSFATQLSSALISTGDSIPAAITIPTQDSLQLIISSPDPPHTIPLRV
jgi:hypothetical protein